MCGEPVSRASEGRRDGQVPVLKGTVPGTMLSGGALPLINGVSVGLNFNQVRTASQSQAIWWGQWEVVDGSQHADPFGSDSA